MSTVLFCPACHHKNAFDASVCSFCGAQLYPGRPADTTTEKKPVSAVGAPGSELLATRHLPKLRAGSIALIVSDDFEHPLIVEKKKTVYLGRFIQNPTASFINLSKYNAVELGVSRTHARIILENDVYLIEDLASTNGTWLNYQRLDFGKSYELHNLDILLLGQLQLTVCLPENLDE